MWVRFGAPSMAWGPNIREIWLKPDGESVGSIPEGGKEDFPR